METGLEVLLGDGTLVAKLSRQKVGLLSHGASVAHGEHAAFALRRVGIDCARYFAPEHGLWGAAQDMEGVSHGYDAIIGRDVVSLYGAQKSSLKPEASSLDGLDAVVIDIQDVGARYYTFAYTALFLAQAGLARGMDVYVLDRPNPIDGVSLEGNLVLPEFESFVGMRPMMTRHGMTVGEMLTMWCEDDGCAMDHFHLVGMRGYDRRMYYEATGQMWWMPSPNMPSVETAVVYPGMCLVEGTNLSEGRGTTRPFELIGAPWVDAAASCKALSCLELPGCVFSPVDFKPMFQKHAHELCHGVYLHVTDRESFRPVLTGLALLAVMRGLHESFRWRDEVYEFEGDRPAIDLLLGDSGVRRAIERQENPYRITEGFEARTQAWRLKRASYLRY